MGAKPPKDGMQEPEAEYRHDEDVELSEADWERRLERNKDALNASCDEAEAEIERGEWSTLEVVMAKVRTEIKRVAKKA